MIRGFDMIKRLNISLFSPGKIAFFLKDKKRYVLGYLFLLTMVLTIPTAIELSIDSGLSSSELSQLSTQVEKQNIDCNITSGVLSNACEITPFNLGPFVVTTTASNDSEYYLVLAQNGVQFSFMNQTLIELSYQDLNLENIDLSLTNETDKETFEQAIVTLFDNTRTQRNTIFVISSFFADYTLFIILALLIAFVYGMMPQRLKYPYRFKMAVYSLSPYVVILLIGKLYGVDELFFIGLFLPYIYMRLAYTGLLNMSKIVIKKEETKD